MASTIKRILSHLIDPPWRVRRAFPPEVLKEVEAAIAASEAHHAGELRFVVEPGLSLAHLLRGVSARQRALEVFAQLHVWDTEDNSGVLIYVLLADRQVEILADRGIHRRVGDGVWQSICHEMESAFRAGRFRDGALAGVREVGHVLAAHFPPRADNPDELPNTAVIL